MSSSAEPKVSKRKAYTEHPALKYAKFVYRAGLKSRTDNKLAALGFATRDCSRGGTIVLNNDVEDGDWSLAKGKFASGRTFYELTRTNALLGDTESLFILGAGEPGEDRWCLSHEKQQGSRGNSKSEAIALDY
jgi:hypothetical protein